MSSNKKAIGEKLSAKCMPLYELKVLL